MLVELAVALGCVTYVDTPELCYSDISYAGDRYAAPESLYKAVTETRPSTICFSCLNFDIFGREVTFKPGKPFTGPLFKGAYI